MTEPRNREVCRDRVTIDGSFIADQAKDALRQFFRPITAAFEAGKPFRSDDGRTPAHAQTSLNDTPSRRKP